MARIPVSLVPALAGLLALAAGAARAGDPAEPGGAAGLRAGDWLVRGRLARTMPTAQRSRIDLIGGRIETPETLIPDAEIAYFLTDHVSVEIQAGASASRPAIRGSQVGDLAIGTVWTAAAMGLVQVHFLPQARFNPYLGLGVIATTPLSIAPAPGIPDFKLRTEIGTVLQVGFDYHLTGRWFANAVAKYVFMPKRTYGFGGVKAEVDLNVLIVGAGLGYRF